MMSQLISQDMDRVYKDLSVTPEHYQLLLESRKVDYIFVRHIIRVLIRAKYNTSFEIIATAESLLMNGREVHHTTIMNSEKIYEDHIVKYHPTLIALIWKVVYQKSAFTKKDISEAIEHLYKQTST